MKKMPKIDYDLLLKTPYDDLTTVFTGMSRANLLKIKRQHLETLSLEDRIKFDTEKRGERKFKDLYFRTSEELERVRKELLETVKIKKPLETFIIEPQEKDGTSEAVAFMIASDWHYEEFVSPGQVNGLNKYNLQIAKDRSVKFFQNGLKLFKMASRDIEIKTIVLGLLGDFISNSIHEELAETNQLLPGDAIWEVQNAIVSGIDFLLRNTHANFIIPCASGNHGRMTKKQRHASEQGNSLETYMYRNIANHFANNKRVKFVISEGYHTYLGVFNYTVRLHHGHAMNYGGGVGGIYISVNKAISQWNKARRADYDFFGHFHQMKDGGNFICNGSMIGYNAFALSIKAEFEKPKQTFCVIDKKRGKTLVCPILFE